MTDRSVTAAPRAVPRWLAVVAVLTLAANLRASVNVIGPLLPQLRADLGMSGFQVGLLTALPTICFALLSMAGARVTAGLGPVRVVTGALVLMVAGQLIRAAAPGLAVLLAGTAVALGAIAVANVLMPALIASYFPDRAPSMTAAYTVTLAFFGALASAGTLPVQTAWGGDWRLGIGMWAAVAVLALLPWVTVLRYGPGAIKVVGDHLSVAEMTHSWRAWVLAAFFGMQALQAYVVFSWYPTMLAAAGLPLTSAAAYVGLVSLASMTGSLVLPHLIHRLGRLWPLVVGINLGFVLGYAGTALAPTAAPWLWALLLGVGTVCFPMGLYIVTQRARTGAGVLSLSGFMQGVGYLLAAVGLVGFATWQGESTSWTPMLIALIVITLVQTVAALESVADWTVEAELGRPER